MFWYFDERYIRDQWLPSSGAVPVDFSLVRFVLDSLGLQTCHLEMAILQSPVGALQSQLQRFGSPSGSTSRWHRPSVLPGEEAGKLPPKC